jgi:hypothetical protein
MLANPAIVNAYYSQVTGAVNNATVGGVTFPCNANLPDLQVDVGGNYMATVRGDDINFAAVDATGQSKFSFSCTRSLSPSAWGIHSEDSEGKPCWPK